MSELRFVTYPDRQSWLEARCSSIGSSDASALMGESNWATPVTLNYAKRGILTGSNPEPDREQDLDWHRRREDEIATWWWERLQIQVEGLAFKAQGPCFLWDPGEFTIAYRAVEGLPLSATFDRLLLRDTASVRTATAADPIASEEWRDTVLSGAIVGVVELKNAGHWMAKHWQEEPPLIYQLQLQHQLMVAGVRPGYLLASIGGQPPVWAQSMRDGEVCGLLRATYARFWDSVVGNYDLPADYREVTGKAITARYPEDDGKTILLDEEAAGWWDARRDLGDSIKVRKQQYDELTNSLKQAMGAASYGVFPDQSTISLIPNKKGQRNLRRVGDDAESSTPEAF